MSLSLTSWPKGPPWSPQNRQRTHYQFTHQQLINVSHSPIYHQSHHHHQEQNGKAATGETRDGKFATTDDTNHVQHDRSCSAGFAGLDADVSAVQPKFTLVTADIQHQTTKFSERSYHIYSTTNMPWPNACRSRLPSVLSSHPSYTTRSSLATPPLFEAPQISDGLKESRQTRDKVYNVTNYVDTLDCSGHPETGCQVRQSLSDPLIIHPWVMRVAFGNIEVRSRPPQYPCKCSCMDRISPAKLVCLGSSPSTLALPVCVDFKTGSRHTRRFLLGHP